MLTFRPLPQSFSLTNIPRITARICELKINPHADHIAEEMLAWFLQFNLYHTKKDSEQYAKRGRFDILAALGFPDADEAHLKTCLAFLYWAFAADDLTDEGSYQEEPEHVKASIDTCRDALYNLQSVPTYPYAAILQEQVNSILTFARRQHAYIPPKRPISLYIRISSTATPGASARFIWAYEAFSQSQIDQSRHRGVGAMPSVDEFIALRRATGGAALVEAMIEYSLDIDLPEYVFENEIIKEMSNATADIIMWPNDLCSFNKEQADNDFQNLVCCIMVERNVELQDAINVLTDMLDTRVTEYLALRDRLPSFGELVDIEVGKYISALERFTHGSVVSLYHSPRYFSKADRSKALQGDKMVLELRKGK